MSLANGFRARRSAPVVSILAGSAESAESAGAQGYPSLDLIRLEDASPEEAIGVLADGLGRARGELAVYLPPGDSLLEGALVRLGAALVARPSVALVYPAFLRVDEHGSEVETVIPEEFDPMEMFRFQYSPVGPGAMFRRDAALEASRLDAGPSPFAEFAFWLRLAAKGGVRRLIEPLASRRIDARPPVRAGVDSAQERLLVYEKLLSELELPAGSEASVRAAGRSACVLAALEFEAGFNDPADRFFVADRFSGRWPAEAAADPDAEIAQLEAHIVNLEQRLARQRAVVPLLEANVAAREDRLAGGRARLTSLSRDIARRLLGSGDAR